MIYTDEETWSAKDHSKRMVAFVETLPSNAFKQVEKFFNTMPKLEHTVTITNPNTKMERIKLEGLAVFSLAMLHQDIVAFYKINFCLMQHHKYSLSDIET